MFKYQLDIYFQDFPFAHDIHIYIHLWRERNSYVQYTLPAKTKEYFPFQRFFAFLWCMKGVSFFLKYIPTSRYYVLGRLFPVNSKINSKVRKLWYWSFFCIRLCLELLASHCEISAISDRVLYRNIVHHTIVYLLPNLVWSAGISIMGASRRRKLGVGFACHKVMSTKPYPVTNNRSFHTE